ncbi:hypothetical protein C8Q78DRAFT_347773 [Trametes maxima]|nr:hypothetical protein C8Q78DRAFT_347773 [Trametes maxima]
MASSNSASPPKAASSPPQPHQTRKATDPFDRDDADLIIRASDSVDFHVHRLILSLASPVFAGMLTFPQPPGTDPDRPVVDVLEDSETLDNFLRVLYPIPDPAMRSLPVIRKVLAAGVKYDAAAVVMGAKRALVLPHVVKNDPLGVFAIACLFEAEAEAKVAAEEAVMSGRVSELARGSSNVLDEISAGAYYRLLKLDRSRKDGSSAKTSTQSNLDFSGVLPFCEGRSKRSSTRQPIPSVTEPFNAPDADLILRSSDSVDFRVLRVIISYASPTFIQQLCPFDIAKGSTSTDEPSLPVYTMTEDSVVVDTLLRMLYPMAHNLPGAADLDLFLDVLEAAHKYALKKVEKLMRETQMILRIKITYPLKLYFSSIKCGAEKEARESAAAIVKNNDVSTIQQQYVPGMETTPAGPYRRLLLYTNQCSAVASASHLLSPGVVICLPSGSTLSYTNSGSSGYWEKYYPSAFHSDAAPKRLKNFFFHARKDLEKRPTGDILSRPWSAKAQILIRHTLDGLPIQIPPEELAFKYTTEEAIAWAFQVLDCFAKQVDVAVAKVKLEIVG